MWSLAIFVCRGLPRSFWENPGSRCPVWIDVPQVNQWCSLAGIAVINAIDTAEYDGDVAARASGDADTLYEGLPNQEKP